MRTTTPGPPPNPNSESTRRRGRLQVLAPPDPTIRPDPPATLTPVAIAAWDAFWQSPMARFVIPTDLPALRRLFRLYDQREAFLDQGLEDPMAEGSQHQPSLSPYLREVDTLDGKILTLEDRFGMSPLSRLKLQVIVGDASRSLAETNKRLATTTIGAPEDDELDLRKPARKHVSGAKV